MPYCPKCFTEYVAGTSECEDCRINLVPGSPPEIEEEDEDSGSGAGKGFGGWFRSLMGAGGNEEAEGPPVRMVTVRSFSGGTASVDAAIARKLLRARGIPSILGGENSAKLLPVLDVSLMVREEDSSRAAEILRIYFDKKGPIEVG